MLWRELNEESNKLASSIETVVHRNKARLAEELRAEGEDMDIAMPVDEDMDDEEYFDYEYIDDDPTEDDD